MASETGAEWQVQVRTICLDCGKGADEEMCVGPYLTYLVVEFDPREFRDDPLGDSVATYDPAKLPVVWDSDGEEIPDHPIVKAMGKVAR